MNKYFHDFSRSSRNTTCIHDQQPTSTQVCSRSAGHLKKPVLRIVRKGQVNDFRQLCDMIADNSSRRSSAPDYTFTSSIMPSTRRKNGAVWPYIDLQRHRKVRNLCYLSTVIRPLINLPIQADLQKVRRHLIKHIFSFSPKSLKALKNIFQAVVRLAGSRCDNVFSRFLHLFNTDKADVVIAQITKNPNESVSIVVHTSDKKLHHLRQDLWKRQMQETKVGDGQPWERFELGVAQLVAKQLITPHGFLNIGLIPVLRTYFLQRDRDQTPFETQIARILLELESNENLVQMLESIEPPPASYAPSQTLIRATLDLPRHKKVTATHCRIAALSGLLAHIRQGELETCFATSLAIQMAEQNALRVLSDYKDMIETGCLKRKVQGTWQEIPLLLHLDDSSLDRPVRILPNGLIEWTRGNLQAGATIPSLAAAARAMGVRDIQSAIFQIHSKLRPEAIDPNLPLVATPRTYLQTMAKVAKEQDPSIRVGARALHYAGRFAMVARSKNALARVWEFSLASLVESSESSYLKQKTIEVILQSSKHLAPETTEAQRAAANAFSLAFCRQLRQKIVHRYEGNTRTTGTLDDYSPSQGGFVLYERDPVKPAHLWKRCGSPQLFQRLLLEALKATIQELREGGQWGLHNSYLTPLYSALRKYFAAPLFLNECLKLFDVKNQDDTEPMWRHLLLNECPWIYRGGNYNETMLTIHHELDHRAAFHNFIPHNATQLTEELIRYGRWCLQQGFVTTGLSKRLPIIINGFHSFSSVVGHKTLRPALTSALPEKTWLEQHFGTLAQDLAQQRTLPCQRNTFFNYVLEHCTPPSLRKKVETRLHRISSASTIQQLRNACLALLSQVNIINDLSQARVAAQLDTYLVREVLPPSTQEAIHEAALLIADTNWKDTLHDRYLCLSPNPGSGQVELWLCDENGNQPEALDQNVWLRRPWSICTEQICLS